MTRASGILTVDLEEWYQGLTSTNPLVERWPGFPRRAAVLTQRLLDMLQAHGVSATFFVVGLLAEQEPALIARIAEGGHELAVHGYVHRYVDRLTPQVFRSDLQCSVRAIQDAVGGATPILGHRAPYFSINPGAAWALDVLADMGFRYDSSLIGSRTTLYGFAGAPRHPVRLSNGLLEFPVSTLRIGPATLPCGGFAWRLLPYPVIRAAIRRQVRASQTADGSGSPLIAYLHPWEMDRAQPRVTRLTPREQITHFYGRWRTRATWERLLRDFTWGPLRSLLAGGEALPAWSW